MKVTFEFHPIKDGAPKEPGTYLGLFDGYKGHHFLSEITRYSTRGMNSRWSDKKWGLLAWAEIPQEIGGYGNADE